MTLRRPTTRVVKDKKLIGKTQVKSMNLLRKVNRNKSLRVMKKKVMVSSINYHIEEFYSDLELHDNKMFDEPSLDYIATWDIQQIRSWRRCWSNVAQV